MLDQRRFLWDSLPYRYFFFKSTVQTYDKSSKYPIGAPVLNIGMGELLVVAVLALIVIGPERLPEVMRFLGKNYAKLKHATSDLRKAFQFEVDKAQGEHRAEIIKARRELLKAKAEAKSLKESISASVQRPNPLLEPPTLETKEEEPPPAQANASAAETDGET